ncbi:rhomboid family intramembrane serine protease [Flavobacterium sp.]|uniref:rhomboid family intramembrane serine protease n=1 Tax=Flavobacterium sp. TaxID=239 RepID=UPI0039E30DA3
MMQITPTVKQLLIINILFFLGTMVVPQAETYFALFPFQNNHFQFWQLLTHMFMHGGIFHIAFNMFALFSFGSALEHFWGPTKFIFFYISCGLGAAALQLGINYWELQHILQGAADLQLSDATLREVLNIPFSNFSSFIAGLEPILTEAGKANLVNETNAVALFHAADQTQIPMVGASGAIYGLLVAFAFMFPNAELALLFIPVPIKAKYFVPGLIAIDLFLGFKGQSFFGSGGTGIAHFAHVGGALIGFIMMWYWKKNQFRGNRWN